MRKNLDSDKDFLIKNITLMDKYSKLNKLSLSILCLR